MVAVGERGTIMVRVGTKELRVEVEVLAERASFGRVQLRVRPVAGRGEAWVDERNVVERRGGVVEE